MEMRSESMHIEERIIPREENKTEQISNDKENDMKLYKAKIKFYFAFGYQKEVVSVVANNIEEAMNKIHSKYDQDMNHYYCHPALIVKIKEVKEYENK